MLKNIGISEYANIFQLILANTILHRKEKYNGK